MKQSRLNQLMTVVFATILLMITTACGITNAQTNPTPEPTSPPVSVPSNTSSPTQLAPTRTRTRVSSPVPNSPTPVTVPSPVSSPTRIAQAPTRRPTQRPTERPTNSAASNDPVIVGAGDIALCGSKGAEATAKLLDAIPGTVFTLGDNAYPSGTAEQFAQCYDPAWGRHKARTRPVPGNHDYVTPGAAGYFGYFGESAGAPTKGYYSYDVGAWHIIVLNSEIDAQPDSAQVQWLRADLAAHPTRCTLAMWHKPLFSSGPHGQDGSGDKTRAFWDVLYEQGADVILNGHDHTYERFALQTPDGAPDQARGIREFVAGTGGSVPYVFTHVMPNSEFRRAGVFGVLKLTLHASSYDWEFIPIVGAGLLRDRGSADCH